MALSAVTIWEVRTTGNNNNGGGYVSGGTDWSQQDSPQYALTGIATGGAGSTFLTATAASDMVGNILQVISGTNFTTGFYQVISVVAGVSVTVDRAICTGVGASGVINIGGCLATIAAALAANVAGNTIYVKATATYTIGAGLTLATSTYTNSTKVIGYTTTRGDNGRATIQASANITGVTISGDGGSFENFVIDANGNTGTGVVMSSQFKCVLKNCIVTGWTAVGINVGSNWGVAVIGCKVTNGTGTSGILAGPWCVIMGCSIVDGNYSVGAIDSAGRNAIIRNLVANNTGAGIVDGSGYASNIIGNTVYGNSGTGVEVKFNSLSIYGCVFNNIIVNNGGYGLSGIPAIVSPVIDFNAFYNNTSGARQNFLASSNDVTLTGDPFTNAAGDDFTLNNTAGAGAACRAVGFPGALLIGGTGYADIGALQHQDSGGGGIGGVLVIGTAAGRASRF